VSAQAVSIRAHWHTRDRSLEVLGCFEDRSDSESFSQALRQSPVGDRPWSIAFYDALTLPREVIDEMAAQLQKGSRLKIHAYHSYLSHTLSKLRLPASHVQSWNQETGSSAPRAIVIGGSADSLEKILYLVEHLPQAKTPIFIVQHVPEHKPNVLDTLLKTRTDYRVLIPNRLCPIEDGTIYIAPPGFHMKVANDSIYLTHDAKISYARPSIDALFESLAREYGAGLLGVLLCGMSRDGIAGMISVRAAGGTALLEESGECSAPYLTNEAREEGAFDFVMGIREITCYAVSALLWDRWPLSEAMIDLFLQAVSSRYGYDYSGYQYGTVRRRIEKLMALLKTTDFHQFQRLLLSDPGVFQRFYLEMSVEVSGFFRHPRQFLLLRRDLFGYLDSFPHLKIWSAGSAGGEEIYSLAMLLDEIGALDKAQLYATDINQFAIEQAKAGLFPLDLLEENRRNYLASGGQGAFDQWLENNGRYLKIPDRYRRQILFYHHSLIHDGVFNEFQLIFCRNVLIYFKPAHQRLIFERFARSLHADGFLVLGESEGLASGEGERFFKPIDRDSRIYRFK
jgi:chemotaxis protein methyltransferase CheR